jgi:uncharacterized protein YprB with RNaseH-like and TPR domain
MTSLQDRLRRLRNSTGNHAEAAAPPPLDAVGSGPSDVAASPSLADRIRRLSGTHQSKRPVASTTPEALAEALGAELVAPGLARLERRYPLCERHGRYRLAACIAASGQPGRTLDGSGLENPIDWTFIDTETSGLAGGTGTWAFVVGIARIDGQALLLRQYLLLQLNAEPALMAAVKTELGSTRLLISFNGKCFDLPLLETRLRLAGTRLETASMAHLDLLYPVRRAFARHWPDCRLATCEQRLLGVRRADDLPGSEAPAAWLEWLRSGQPARLGAVLRHNRLDLLSLATLIPALVEVEHRPIAQGADIGAIARHLCRQQRNAAAEHLLERHRNDLDVSERLLLARLKRRRDAWADAVSIWEALIEEAGDAALLELAKYHEHVPGDCAQALAYTERLSESAATRQRRHRLQKRLSRKPKAHHDSA